MIVTGRLSRIATFRASGIDFESAEWQAPVSELLVEGRPVRFFEFKSVALVHIDYGPASIIDISKSELVYKDDAGEQRSIDFEQCARVQRCLRNLGGFPPTEDTDWGALIDSTPNFADTKLPLQPIIGLRGVLDEPPWFQFLDRRRTQFEFKDRDHIRKALLDPLAQRTGWYTWDAC